MVINIFKNKVFPLNDPANFPEYVSEDDIPSRRSSLWDAIAAVKEVVVQIIMKYWNQSFNQNILILK